MTAREQAAFNHALEKVLGLVRLAAGLLGPVAGAPIARWARREVRLALRAGEALYRRAIALLAMDMLGEVDAARPARPARPAEHRPCETPGRPALALTETLQRFPHGTPYAGPAGTPWPDDPVSPGALQARLERLRDALADPVRRARKLALWLTRPGRRRLSPFRPGWPPGRRRGKAHAPLNQLLSWLNGIAREAVAARPP